MFVIFFFRIQHKLDLVFQKHKPLVLFIFTVLESCDVVME